MRRLSVEPERGSRADAWMGLEDPVYRCWFAGLGLPGNPLWRYGPLSLWENVGGPGNSSILTASIGMSNMRVAAIEVRRSSVLKVGEFRRRE